MHVLTTLIMIVVLTSTQMEISEEKVRRLLEELDTNQDGALQVNEFDAFATSADKYSAFFTGSPSTPGFMAGEFDRLSSWALSTSTNQPIVPEYKPDGLWLWTKWEGSIKQMTWKSAVTIMIWALALNLFAYYHYTTYVLGDCSSECCMV